MNSNPSTSPRRSNGSGVKAENIYQPNPSEEAYAFYVLDKAFSIKNYFDADFQIHGRDAVPFLSTSGIDRLILRNVWNVADPKNVGYLTCIAQFHCILRLISLAQVGILTKDLAKSIHEQQQKIRKSETPARVMIRSLHDSKTNYDLPLATFEGISKPSVDFLKNLYYEVKGNGDDAGRRTTPPRTVSGDSQSGFGIASQMQGQQLSMQQQPQIVQDKEDDFGGFEQASPQSGSEMGGTGGMSVFDALGGLQDAPLPSLGQQMPVNGGAGDSGGFAAVTQEGGGQSGMSAFDALAAVGTTQNAPLPSLGQMSSNTTNNMQGFESAQMSTVENSSGIDNNVGFASTNQQGLSSGMSAFDALSTGEQDVPLPSLGQNSNMQDSTAIGGVGFSTTTANQQEQSGMSAFGALGSGASDAPLPSMGRMSLPNTNNGMQSAGLVSNLSMQSSNNDDEFGGFSSSSNQQQESSSGMGAFDVLATATGAQSVPLPSMSNNLQSNGANIQTASLMPNLSMTSSGTSNEFGGFSSSNQQQEPSSGMGAFDALAAAGTQTAPLPSMSNAQSHEINMQSAGALLNSNIHSNDNVFGGFSSLNQQEQSSMGAFDALAAGAQNAPLPSMSNVQLNGGAASVMPNSNIQSNDDDFGGFSSSNQQQEPNGMDTFDSIADGAQDTRLPSLSNMQSNGNSMQAAGALMPNPNMQSSDGDNFGGFSAPIQQEPSGMGVFDALAAEAQQPSNVQPNDEFGGFSTGDQQQEQSGMDALNALASGTNDAPNPNQQINSDFAGFSTGNHQQDSGMSAFDSLGSGQDAPLPSLGQMPQSSGMGTFQTVAGGVQDAPPPSMGDMASGANNMQVAEPTQNANIASNDDFGGFSGAGQPVQSGMGAFDALVDGAQDAPLPSVGQISNDANASDNNFGGFTGANQQMQSGMSAFDALAGGVQEVPLANMNQMPTDSNNLQAPETMQATDIQTSNSFGGFPDVNQQQQAGMGAFDTVATMVQDTPLPSIGQMPVAPNSMQVPESMQYNNEFGGFSGSNQQEKPGMGAFDALARGVQDAPLPSIGQPSCNGTNMQAPVSNQSLDVPSNDGFVGFSAANQQEQSSPELMQPENIASGNDFSGFSGDNQQDQPGMGAFDALAGEVQDTPLPSIGPIPSGPESMQTSESIQPTNVVSDDDFGGFSGQTQQDQSGMGAFDAVAGGVQDTPLPGMGPIPSGPESVQTSELMQPTNVVSDDDFGGYSGGNQQDQPGMGAFDALAGGVQDTPLPGMGPIPSGPESMQTSESIQPTNVVSDDDFGGFSGPTQHDQAGMGAFDAVGGGVQDTPLPGMGPIPSGPESMQTSESIQPTNVVSDDDFVGFSGNNQQDQSGMGAFDALAEGVQDTPLPSIGQISSSANNMQTSDSMQSANVASDDFGGFSGVDQKELPGIDAFNTENAQVKNSSDGITTEDSFGGFASGSTQQAAGMNAFDTFAESGDAPLPNQAPVSTENILTTTTGGDDDFGGFSTGVNQGASVVGAFDALANGAQDAPLPSLGDSSPSALNNKENIQGEIGSNSATNEDDDFGGFSSGISHETPGVDASDVFASAPQSAPLAQVYSNSENTKEQNVFDNPAAEDMDDFDGFSSAKSKDISGSVPFDAFAGGAYSSETLDAPFPSLGEPTSTVAENAPADDNFGGFFTSTTKTGSVADGSDEFGENGQGVQNPGQQDQINQPNIPAPKPIDNVESFYTARTKSACSSESDLFRDPARMKTTGSSQADDLFHDAVEDSSDLGITGDGPKEDSNSALDAAVASQDGEAPPAVSDDEEDWGGFENVPNDASTSSAAAHSEEKKSNEQEVDGFGSFEDADPKAVQSETQKANEQQINGFGSFENAAPGPSSEMEASDDFGNFESFEKAEGPAGTPVAPIVQPPPEDFGGFAAFGDVPETQAATAENNISNDFGDFENAAASKQAAQLEEGLGKAPKTKNAERSDQAATIQNPDVEVSVSESFGDFETGVISPAAPAKLEQQESDDFGAFDSPSAPPQATVAEISSSSSFDAFGDFDSAQPTIAEIPISDGFGDFGSAPSSQPTVAEIPVSDGFGDFGSAPPPTSEGQPTIAEIPASDGFGDFDSALSSTQQATIAAIPPADGFGDFESFPASNESTTAELKSSSNDFSIRNEIVSLCQQVPENLRTKKNGNDIDLKECFDVNIGPDDISSSADRKRRAERCKQVLSLLSSTHTRLGSTYWTRVISTARDELSVGLFLLDEACTLSASDIRHVMRSLQIMVAGLAEFVRVSRCIVATVGDMMSLDVSALLTIDTLSSTWCSIALAEMTLEVEKIWKDINARCSKLGISVIMIPNRKLESIPEIRSKSMERYKSNELCQFSLQPLSQDDQPTTKAIVEWNGKKFMACTANFLANKCSFYDVRS